MTRLGCTCGGGPSTKDTYLGIKVRRPQVLSRPSSSSIRWVRLFLIPRFLRCFVCWSDAAVKRWTFLPFSYYYSLDVLDFLDFL